jgi:two-component system KDP operon response regulator KdpE
MEPPLNQKTSNQDSVQPHTRLLIADDNPGVVKALAVRLFSQGYECITALNGHEAMQFMADPGIDALITDLDMPYLDGYSLIDLATEFKPCRCIVITGSAEKAMRCYREFPGVPVMMKPFEAEHIITALREAPLIGPRTTAEAA